MSVQALIFDLDGTIADTEEIHRQAFNAAFIKLELWWDWGPSLCCDLLEVSGGTDRLHHYVDTLNASPQEKARLHAIVPVIHYTKSQIYAELLRAGQPPLRPGVKRLIDEAHGGVRGRGRAAQAGADFLLRDLSEFHLCEKLLPNS